MRSTIDLRQSSFSLFFAARLVRTAATSIEDGGATFDWVGAADADADADGAGGEAPEVEGAAVCPGAAPDAGGAGAACAAGGWGEIGAEQCPTMLLIVDHWIG